jgi:hypothetical protein
LSASISATMASISDCSRFCVSADALHFKYYVHSLAES